LPVLIATTIFDEGVDVSGINCLFLAGGGKSMRQLLQRIGRGLRKKADGSGIEVYDVLDYHNEHLARHTLERYKVYKSEGFDIIKLEA
jgi:superfamily II DNA or RNA helicase